jgi:hypothetical protein
MQAKKSLVLSLSEFELDPSGDKAYAMLGVKASSGSFSGTSACFLADHDFAAFLDNVDSLAAGHSAEAMLVGGWGSTEDVRIHFYLANRSGHIRIRVVLAEVPDHKERSQLEVFFETEPQPLLHLSAMLRQAFAERKPGQFRVYVLNGPAI